MGMEFNFIKFDASVFSLTYEITKKTLLMVLLKPHWVFASVTITTMLANKETFPMYNRLQWIKNCFGGSWLKFALEFNIAIAWICYLLFLLSMLIVIVRAIKNRDDCYSFSYIPIHLLIQLGNNDLEDPLYWILLWVFEKYYYISTLYTNYLILATPNFSQLYLLIEHDRSMALAVFATPMMLLGIFGNLFSTVGHFLEISD